MLNNETTTLLNNFPEFPGDLPVKNVVFTAVAWVQTLAWELSHAPAAAKKKKKKIFRFFRYSLDYFLSSTLSLPPTPRSLNVC